MRPEAERAGSGSLAARGIPVFLDEAEVLPEAVECHFADAVGAAEAEGELDGSTYWTRKTGSDGSLFWTATSSCRDGR